MGDNDPLDTFSYVVRELDRRRIGYLTLLEPNEQDLKKGVAIEHVAKTFRPMTSAPLIAKHQARQGQGHVPTPSPMVHSISPILIWLPASRRTRRSASPIPLLSMARVPKATPTIRRFHPKTRPRRAAQLSSSRPHAECPVRERGADG
jgi:hypothetical protein